MKQKTMTINDLYGIKHASLDNLIRWIYNDNYSNDLKNKIIEEIMSRDITITKNTNSITVIIKKL